MKHMVLSAVVGLAFVACSNGETEKAAVTEELPVQEETAAELQDAQAEYDEAKALQSEIQALNDSI